MGSGPSVPQDREPLGQPQKSPSMKRITPFLWFSKDAEKAARFYTSIFKDSKLVSTGPMSARFRIEGLEFIAFNGGPGHAFTPAVSMFVSLSLIHI